MPKYCYYIHNALQKYTFSNGIEVTSNQILLLLYYLSFVCVD